MFTFVTTEYFLRRARKFLREHPDLRERFARIVDDLKQDPFAPHLAYHHFGGKLKGAQAQRRGPPRPVRGSPPHEIGCIQN